MKLNKPILIGIGIILVIIIVVVATQVLSEPAGAAGGGNTGSVSVSSTPSGASVYLDGSLKGTTPLTIARVSVGNHTLRLTKTGYQNYVTTVTVQARKTTTVSATLIPVTTSTIATTSIPTTSIPTTSTVNATTTTTILPTTSVATTTLLNLLPVVNLTASPTSGTSPLFVSFTVLCNDPDGTISSCLLIFGDGSAEGLSAVETLQFTNHTYVNGGNSSITRYAILNATDNDGAVGVSVKPIIVNP